MDSACPEKDVTEILSDSDHSTKVAPTTLKSVLSKKKYRKKISLGWDTGLKCEKTNLIALVFHAFHVYSSDVFQPIHNASGTLKYWPTSGPVYVVVTAEFLFKHKKNKKTNIVLISP